MQSTNCCTASLAGIFCNTISKLMEWFYQTSNHQQKWSWQKIIKKTHLYYCFPVNCQQIHLKHSCILWKFGFPFFCNDASRASILKHYMTWIEERKWWTSNGWICAWAMVKTSMTTPKKMLLFMFLIFNMMIHRIDISSEENCPN